MSQSDRKIMRKSLALDILDEELNLSPFRVYLKFCEFEA